MTKNLSVTGIPISKDFSLILMKQIVTYCNKTEEKTQTSITEIEAPLKQQPKKDDYAEIQNIIKVNETAKLKNFNTLKYKPKLLVSEAKISKWSKSTAQSHCNRWSETNIPLQETIDLCVGLFFNDKPNIDGFTTTDFHELLTITMSESLVFFNN